MAIVEAKPGRYFSLVAFVYGPAHPRDYLAAVWRDKDGPWHLSYRFRYYAPEDGKRDAFDGRDEKRFYEMTAPRDTPEKTVTDSLRELANMLVKTDFNSTVDFIDVCSDDPATVMDAFTSRPWAHVATAMTSKGGDA